jgi:alanyl-tRNA synthetase
LLKGPKNLVKSVENLLEDNSRLKKELEKAVLEKAGSLKYELAQKAEEINGINFIAEKVSLPNAEAIKSLAYSVKDIVPNLFLVLASEIDGKPGVTVMISENIVKDKGLNAGAIVKELAKEIQGRGGGQPFYATAGGKDAAGLTRIPAKAKELIS